MVKIGNSEITGAYLGNVPASALYLGSTKVYPIQQEYTYILENLQLHYSTSGAQYLTARRSNYAYVTADYKTYQGSILISIETVVCHPVYELVAQPIETVGDYIYWDKNTYGTTLKAQTTISVKGRYAGITTLSSVTVTTEENAPSTSYTYEKSLVISGIAPSIPSEGGTYNYVATSYRTPITYWTSQETSIGSQEPYTSTLSCDKAITISYTDISGETSGTVSFPTNITEDTIDYKFDLYNTAGGHYYKSYSQDAGEAPYFNISPEFWNAASDEVTKSIAVDTNVTFTVEKWHHTTQPDFITRISPLSPANTITVYISTNTSGVTRVNEVVFHPQGLEDVRFTITQS